MPGTRPEIDVVFVAVPARDEDTSIGACIRSIVESQRQMQPEWRVPVRIVIAADSCSDRTASEARCVPSTVDCSIEVIEGSWGSASAARRAAVAHLFATSQVSPERVWLANTDADCAVPSDWLTTHLGFSRTHAAVAGLVELEPRSGSPELLELFRTTYLIVGDGHHHVHGANLGVRGDVYADVGGWCPHTVVGEDHGLWHRLRTAGHAVVHVTTGAVQTSARTVSRVDGGFATTLAGLLVAPAS